jgi:glutathione synthase/RimK-type ligase-like ATP-grasp enzyme
MSKIKAIVLANERENDHDLWVRACTDFKDKLEFRVVNLTSNSWLEDILIADFDILLAKPGGLIASYKQLYDERIYILEKELGYKVYPSSKEIFIYENKRFFSFWLKAHQIAHPATNVFYHKNEAESFLKGATYPIVAKTNIGASGSGVCLLKAREDALRYINDTFLGKGAWQRSGPNLQKGGLLKRGLHYVIHPNKIGKKLKVFKAINDNFQKGFVIFQQYVPHEFEWRVVRIGNSFFAHKKLKMGEKASGSLLKNYDNPPLEIFNFVKEITDRHQLFSQSVDVFETNDGKYLVNEMQCIFGQSDAYQMMVDGHVGRYTFVDGNWVFEKGDFNKNESYNLRIEWVLKSMNHND